MEQLDGEGFDFDNGYMFGFSFGAWLAIKTAKTFGTKRFAQIDGERKRDVIVGILSGLWQFDGYIYGI